MAVNNPEKGRLETSLMQQYPIIFGVDEVGRGCLAGPVFAACVYLDYQSLERLDESEKLLIRDSKTLSQKQRAFIGPVIEKIAKKWAVSSSSVREIEKYGIVPATFRAMRRAIRQCGSTADMLLLDGRHPLPRYSGAQKAIIAGDSLCYSIAAASILAKEARDQYMRDQAEKYPAYDFSANVGYGTARHLKGLATHGICPLHRRNFAPIAKYVDASPD